MIVRLEEVPGAELRLSPRDLAEASVVSRLEHRLAGLERLRDEAAQRRERAHEELERMASGAAAATWETATAGLHASGQWASVAGSVDVVEAICSHQAGR